MNGETSPARKAIPLHAFYESKPKRSRLHESENLKTTTITATTTTTTTSSSSNNKALQDRSSEIENQGLPTQSEKNKITIITLKEESSIQQPAQPQRHQEQDVSAKGAGKEETGKQNRDRDSPIPLKNLGNTCYENSIIQCLFSLDVFMDRFEESMKTMRQLVKPVKSNSSDAALANAEEDSAQDKKTDETIEIAESDVRYRIANAFENLYRSYTKRRNQLESDNQNLFKPAPSTSSDNDVQILTPLEQNSSTSKAPESEPEQDFDWSVGWKAKPATKAPSNHEDQISPLPNLATDENAEPASDIATTPITSDPVVYGPAPAPTTSTTTTTDTAATNLTPIALVSSISSAPNEQLEIETRLEELKSAVGERSSQFNSTHQQDASEFFYHVIDSIQEFYQGLQRTNDDDNPVTKVFELELDYLIRCPKCHHRTMSEPEKIRTLPLALPNVNENTSNADEFNPEANGIPTPPTSDLGLDSPKSSDSTEQNNGSPSNEKENQTLVETVSPSDNSSNTVSIAKLELSDKQENNQSSATNTPHQPKHYTLCDALNNYFKDDLLEYNCSQQGCDSKQRTKKCLIRKLPQVLFITLARYSYTGKKSLEEIEAPFELSVPFKENKSPSHSPSAHRDFNDDDDKYRLVAVVCHLGSSLNAGHYTSYVYNQNNFSWYSCDDDSITKVQEADVKTDASKSGYCFFYAHKSCVAYDIEKDNSNQARLTSTNEQKSLEYIRKAEAMIVSSSVADSSVVMTPEPSPQLSPTQSVLSYTENMSPKQTTTIGPSKTDSWWPS